MENVDLSLEALQFYEDHPTEFCEDLLGVELDDWQEDAFKHLYKDHFVAIRAGSGVGKSVWLSLATMHFLATKPFSKVPTTAPSQHQLFDILWAEHHKNITRSEFLNKLLVWTQTKVAVRKYEPQWYAVARTARANPTNAVSEGLQGFHAEKNLMYIVDEASGAPDAIFPALEGALTGENAYAILAANPTRLSGYFYEVFNNPRMRGLYYLMHVSAEKSKFVDQRYLTMMEARYGRDHPIYQIKVLGDFPSSDVELLFPLDDVEKMKYNEPPDLRGDRSPIEIGMDVGRTTNRSVMCIRKDLRVLEFQEKYLQGTTVDTIDLVQWALIAINAFNPTFFKIDANGIGAGVYDHLVRIYPKIVRPVIGQALPAESKRSRYVNLRAQGYWELREMVPYLSSKKWPDRLFDEMSDIRYELVNGKIKIQSKKDMTSASPDYTDSLVYAFLDADICTDKFNIVINPALLGSVNQSLTKENPLLHLSKGRMGRPSGMSSKYGALYE